MITTSFYIKPAARLIICLLVIIYIIGIIGFYQASTRQLMVSLTPYNLLFAGGLALLFHQPKTLKFFIFCLACLVFGFFYEVAGVNTGIPFGKYHYTSILGWKLFAVPVIIAFNWLILTYTSAALVRLFIKNKWKIAAMATILVLIYDFFLEPVAMQLRFWQWEQSHIPLQNYLGWLAGAMLLQSLQTVQNIQKNKNTVAAVVFVIQLAFIIVLYIKFR